VKQLAFSSSFTVDRCLLNYVPLYRASPCFERLLDCQGLVVVAVNCDNLLFPALLERQADVILIMQSMSGGWYGNQSHCNTSKYHQACIYYSQGLPWPQAQARAAKDWAKWGSDASVSRTPARRPPELREWSRSAPQRRTGRRGSEEGQGLSSVQGSQGAGDEEENSKNRASARQVQNVPVPARKTGKEAAKKAPANKKPVLPPTEESSQYSYLEDEEEELGEGSISDKEVDPDSLKTTTTKSKPAASKADAKSKATKVAPAASSSWKPGGAEARRQRMESMAKLYEVQAATMRSLTD